MYFLMFVCFGRPVWLLRKMNVHRARASLQSGRGAQAKEACKCATRAGCGGVRMARWVLYGIRMTC